MPPGVVFGNTAPCERELWDRAIGRALLLTGIVDTYAFDWGLRQKSAAHVNLFILNGCPVPALVTPAASSPTPPSASPATTRATSCSAWRAARLRAWREPSPRFTWPGPAGDDARGAVGLGRHRCRRRPRLRPRPRAVRARPCASATARTEGPRALPRRLRRIQSAGLEAFLRARPRRSHIPLVESLPSPVIDLPEPAPAEEGAAADGASARPHAGPGGARAASRASATGAPTAGRPNASRSGQMLLLPPDDGPLFRPARREAEQAPRPAPLVSGSVTPLAAALLMPIAPATTPSVPSPEPRASVRSAEVQGSTRPLIPSRRASFCSASTGTASPW